MSYIAFMKNHSNNSWIRIRRRISSKMYSDQFFLVHSTDTCLANFSWRSDQ